MEPIRFGSKIEVQVSKKKGSSKKNLAKNLNTFFGSLSKYPDFLICREYIYGNIEFLVWCFRKYILYI